MANNKTNGVGCGTLMLILFLIIAMTEFCKSDKSYTDEGENGPARAVKIVQLPEMVKNNINKLIRDGVIIYKADIPLSIYINDQVWNGLNINEKEKIAIQFGLYVGNKNKMDSAFCVIRSLYTGKELATYSPSMGLSIK